MLINKWYRVAASLLVPYSVTLLRRTGVMALLLASTASLAEVRMESIEFSSLPGDKTEIRMDFTGPPPEPTGYTIEQPARIALDLVGVTSGLETKYHPLGSGNAQSVTVVEAGDRTRIIVAMTELVAYQTYIEDNTLYMLVGKKDAPGFVEQGREANVGESLEEEGRAESSSHCLIPVSAWMSPPREAIS